MLKDKFEQKVWCKLSKEEQERLSLLFEWSGSSKIPCSLVIAAMRLVGEEDRELLKGCYCDEEMIYKLSFEEFGWGALLKHRYLGLLEDTPLSIEEKERLERLVKSSLDLEIEEKMLFFQAAKEMKREELLSVLYVLHNEMMEIHRRFLQGEAEGLKAKIEQNKRVWQEWEERIKKVVFAQNLEQDEDGIFLPNVLASEVKEYVKAQDRAVESLAIHFYYQRKLREKLIKKETPSYRVDPVLLIGGTGQGKSFMVKKFCEISGLDYLYIDASSMVRTGIRGMNIDEMIKSIIRRCDYDLQRAQSAVVVLDEFDKVLQPNDTYNDSILSQLLRLIEGTLYMIEKNSSEEAREFQNISFLDTSYIFFILVGSFEWLREETHSGFLFEKSDESYEKILERSGLPKELQGRIKEIVELKRLDESAMMTILKGASSPLRKYERMMEDIGGEFTLSEEELKKIAKKAAMHPSGARALDKLLYQRFKPHFLTPKHNGPKSAKTLFLKTLEAKLI